MVEVSWFGLLSFRSNLLIIGYLALAESPMNSALSFHPSIHHFFFSDFLPDVWVQYLHKSVRAHIFPRNFFMPKMGLKGKIFGTKLAF